VRVDDRPPQLTVRVVGARRVHWEAVDPGTPWLWLTAELTRGRRHVQLDLGRRGLAGSALLRLPRGRWHVLLSAANSAGKSVTVSLGRLPRRGASAAVAPRAATRHPASP
jgi:hypothetical protein